MVAMDNCVVPIELIEVICGHDLRNWNRLIRTCRAIHRALVGLREGAKVAVRSFTMAKVYDDDNRDVIKCEWGQYHRHTEICDRGDHWEILCIMNFVDGSICGEALSRVGGSTYMYWYHDMKCVGRSTSNGSGNCKYMLKINGSWDFNKVITREQIKAELDRLGVKYVRLNYLPEK